MNNRDLHNHIEPAVAIAAAALDADTTPSAIDLQGFESAEIIFSIGAGGITFTSNNKVEFVLTHSDNNSSYDNVTADDVLGLAGGPGALTAVTNGIVGALTAAHATAAVYKLGYVGGRRYLKLKADFSGTHASPTPMSSTVIKGHPRISPYVA